MASTPASSASESEACAPTDNDRILRGCSDSDAPSEEASIHGAGGRGIAWVVEGGDAEGNCSESVESADGRDDVSNGIARRDDDADASRPRSTTRRSAPLSGAASEVAGSELEISPLADFALADFALADFALADFALADFARGDFADSESVGSGCASSKCAGDESTAPIRS